MLFNTLLCYTNSRVLFLEGVRVDLNKVYDRINNDKIKVFPFGIDGIKAVTIETNDKHGIFINKKEIKDSDEEFCVLTHEYGHCATGSTHKLYSPFDLICRHEYRADRKAILEFLPVSEIKRAIENGSQTVYEIAEFLDMPEDFVSKAIRHYKCMGMI